MMLPLVVIVAQLSAAQIDAAKATYGKLAPAEVEAKKLDVPPADAQKIDVSSRIRSASFGHKTWLVLAPDGTRFWIEWGKSTNRPGALFGPFPIAAGHGPPDAGAPPDAGKPFPQHKKQGPPPEDRGPMRPPPAPER
jgi:hypothetical protein